jgi:hypothetical protein
MTVSASGVSFVGWSAIRRIVWPLTVAEHRARDGKVHITLRLPLRMFEKWKSPIVRRVIATFYPLQSLRDEHPTYSVSWSARGGGPFPEFAGALAGAKLPCDDYFGLILSGHYEPPLGTMGALFDAILGHPIAHGLAQDLLQSIAAHLENASGPAVSMFRARKTPREKAARMTQVNHRTTVPILALPYGIIRNWNQLDGRAVIRKILTNRPRSCIISSRLRNRSAWATCHHTYANATPKRHSQPLDHASRVTLEQRKVRHRRRLFDSSGERARIASLNLSTTAICENLL